eukprot:TRINITY_DN33891_c0_g1_i1.p1 TRINITY_DN33891_c0_g1~~TRINITY_DN33891_c0_g1_i1.p1  ORF type:complete len:556 (-),score=120.22 TRINITY_DN33891_c0_g1_i1:105-1733(-)
MGLRLLWVVLLVGTLLVVGGRSTADGDPTKCRSDGDGTTPGRPTAEGWFLPRIRFQVAKFKGLGSLPGGDRRIVMSSQDGLTKADFFFSEVSLPSVVRGCHVHEQEGKDATPGKSVQWTVMLDRSQWGAFVRRVKDARGNHPPPIFFQARLDRMGKWHCDVEVERKSRAVKIVSDTGGDQDNDDIGGLVPASVSLTEDHDYPSVGHEPSQHNDNGWDPPAGVDEVAFEVKHAVGKEHGKEMRVAFFDGTGHLSVALLFTDTPPKDAGYCCYVRFVPVHGKNLTVVHLYRPRHDLLAFKKHMRNFRHLMVKKQAKDPDVTEALKFRAVRKGSGWECFTEVEDLTVAPKSEEAPANLPPPSSASEGHVVVEGPPIFPSPSPSSAPVFAPPEFGDLVSFQTHYSTPTQEMIFPVEQMSAKTLPNHARVLTLSNRDGTSSVIYSFSQTMSDAVRGCYLQQLGVVFRVYGNMEDYTNVKRIILDTAGGHCIPTNAVFSAKRSGTHWDCHLYIDSNGMMVEDARARASSELQSLEPGVCARELLEENE